MNLLKKKNKIKLFEILGITKINIIIDMGNLLVIFQNIYAKSYYYYIKKTNISYPEIIKIKAFKLAMLLFLQINIYILIN